MGEVVDGRRMGEVVDGRRMGEVVDGRRMGDVERGGVTGIWMGDDGRDDAGIRDGRRGRLASSFWRL
jgi:hypothetical protein